jgi:hypothetical protein
MNQDLFATLPEFPVEAFESIGPLERSDRGPFLTIRPSRVEVSPRDSARPRWGHPRAVTRLVGTTSGPRIRGWFAMTRAILLTAWRSTRSRVRRSMWVRRLMTSPRSLAGKCTIACRSYRAGRALTC